MEDAKERRARTMTACANASVMPLTARKLTITANPPEKKEDTTRTFNFNLQQREIFSLAHREQPTLHQSQPIAFHKATLEQAGNTEARCKPARCDKSELCKIESFPIQHSALCLLN